MLVVSMCLMCQLLVVLLTYWLLGVIGVSCTVFVDGCC